METWISRVASLTSGCHSRRGFALTDLVHGFFAKDGHDDHDCYLTRHLPLRAAPAVFIDDRPEDLSSGLDVLARGAG
jgi:hypothetical protein